MEVLATRAERRVMRVLRHIYPCPAAVLMEGCGGATAATPPPPPQEPQDSAASPTTRSKSKLDLSQDVVADLVSPHLEETRETRHEVELEITKDAHGIPRLAPVPGSVTFDQGFFCVVHAIELLRDEMPEDRVVMVGIAGPSGAGKTALATKIAATMEAVVIPLQNFVKVESVEDGNFEDPTAYDFALVTQTLESLRAGRPVDVPVVSTQASLRRIQKGVVTMTVPESRLVIVEGSYTLHASTRRFFDITVAIDGGIHLDLIKHIMRDMKKTENYSDTLNQVTNVIFPMYKAFMEPDLQHATIHIHSKYNPMDNMTQPMFVCKAKFSRVEGRLNMGLFPNRDQSEKNISDMYLYPPHTPDDTADRRNWIRIRRLDGRFFIYFYHENMGLNLNVRPTINFEISIKTLSGLLSLGYQIGAILHRTIEVWYNESGLIVTKEHIDELENDYIQVKGKRRTDVEEMAKKLHLGDHHIPKTFLYLYFKKLMKQTQNEAPV